MKKYCSQQKQHRPAAAKAAAVVVADVLHK
jgi:hypothetical protein